MGLLERLADDKDPMRVDLQTARSWHVSPTMFLGERTEGPAWTMQDTEYARALAVFEASLCPGCAHDLAETTNPANEGRYEVDPTQTVICHRCAGRASAAKQFEHHTHPEALLIAMRLRQQSEQAVDEAEVAEAVRRLAIEGERWRAEQAATAEPVAS